MDSRLWFSNNNEIFVYTNSELGEILISGTSSMEKSFDFFSPITDWAFSYLKNNTKPLHIHIALAHWNTFSHHAIYGIVSTINSSDHKERVRISWHYNHDDDDVLEGGEDFSDIVKFPFVLVEHKNEEIFTAKRAEHSPLVYFDNTGDFIIQGNSTIDSPLDFYIKPLMWLNAHLHKTTLKEVSIEIHLESIADSNIPFIQALIQTADCLNKDGSIVIIQWSYSNPEVEMIGEKCLENISSHYFFRKIASK